MELTDCLLQAQHRWLRTSDGDVEFIFLFNIENFPRHFDFDEWISQ